MTISNSAPEASRLVVCLCAQWCGVCRDYRAAFAQVQAQFPQIRFLWIDVEDEADLLHPLEVENFPTLLLAVGTAPRFFGPLPPQPALLERLIRARLQDATEPALAEPAVIALLGRILGSRAGF
jgi:thiol-disulfide isomerase/thioredoxin